VKEGATGKMHKKKGQIERNQSQERGEKQQWRKSLWQSRDGQGRTGRLKRFLKLQGEYAEKTISYKTSEGEGKGEMGHIT